MSVSKLIWKPYYSSFPLQLRERLPEYAPNLRRAASPSGSIYLSLRTVREGQTQTLFKQIHKNLKLGQINLGHYLSSVTVSWGKCAEIDFLHAAGHQDPSIASPHKEWLFSWYFVMFTSSLHLCSVTLFPFLPSLSGNSSGLRATALPRV